jgi:hypothetical protein
MIAFIQRVRTNAWEGILNLFPEVIETILQNVKNSWFLIFCLAECPIFSLFKNLGGLGGSAKSGSWKWAGDRSRFRSRWGSCANNFHRAETYDDNNEIPILRFWDFPPAVQNCSELFRIDQYCSELFNLAVQFLGLVARLRIRMKKMKTWLPSFSACAQMQEREFWNSCQKLVKSNSGKPKIHDFEYLSNLNKTVQNWSKLFKLLVSSNIVSFHVHARI